jgi:hypothetical protein
MVLTIRSENCSLDIAMTTWNYRVIKKACTPGQDVTYQIHEIYYREDGSVDCWNHTPVEPLGISESGLRNDIQSFLGAFRLPILEEQYVNGKETLVAEAMTDDLAGLEADYVSKASRASSYLYQVLGNHLLLKKDPSLRNAYEKVDQALNNLYEVVSQSSCTAEA